MTHRRLPYVIGAVMTLLLMCILVLSATQPALYTRVLPTAQVEMSTPRLVGGCRFNVPDIANAPEAYDAPDGTLIGALPPGDFP
ncbi:MAG: hypothetical protein AAF125_06855, partial [Chloroflexota bacterium]